MENAEIIPSAQALVEFGSFRSPDQALKEADMVAKAFQRKALALGLYQAIGESKHLKIEGWQMLAAMYRVTASVPSTRYVEFGDARGWEATAEAIYVPTGQRISTADAMCLDDEDKWGAVSKYEWQETPGGRQKVKVGDVRKPLQQLRSMAQTRACSKVLSNLLKWVCKMAGFATTPAEEMTGNEGHENGGAPPQSAGNGPGPQRTQASGNVISEAQSKRFYAISKQSGKSDDQIVALLQHFGCSNGREIPRDKYEAVCAAVQDANWRPPATQQQTAQGGGPANPWAEVVRAYGGEVKALVALNENGFERWDQVNISDRTAMAMKLIEQVRR